MFYIDSNKCTGCGVCVGACPRQAVSIQNDIAVIKQGLCSQCGTCATVCPADAIRSRVPVYTGAGERGDIMRGRGFGVRGGMGFGFRRSSRPWPYGGRGRGGLPRRWSPGLYTSPPFYGGYPAGDVMPYSPQMTSDQELNFLKEEANAVKERLEQIDARIQELESEKE